MDQDGRAPQHGEDRDIFERLYAVRLERLREQDDCSTLLKPLDHQGLLAGAKPGAADLANALDDDALLAELGVKGTAEMDITALRHVRSRAEINAAEEIANRDKCADFEHFKPLFRKAEDELASGARKTHPFGKDASVAVGDFFILGGQVVYVAERGEDIKAPNGSTDARLRVIYSNGTESNLLLRSLQRALYKADQIVDQIRALIKKRDVSFFSWAMKSKDEDKWDSMSEDELKKLTMFMLSRHSPRSTSGTVTVTLETEGSEKVGIMTLVASAKMPRSAAIIAEPSISMPPVSQCEHCNSSRLQIKYGHNYYFACLNCAKNTRINLACPTCGASARIRKEKLNFYKECECGFAEVFFENPG